MKLNELLELLKSCNGDSDIMISIDDSGSDSALIGVKGFRFISINRDEGIIALEPAGNLHESNPDSETYDTLVKMVGMVFTRKTTNKLAIKHFEKYAELEFFIIKDAAPTKIGFRYSKVRGPIGFFRPESTLQIMGHKGPMSARQARFAFVEIN